MLVSRLHVKAMKHAMIKLKDTYADAQMVLEETTLNRVRKVLSKLMLYCIFFFFFFFFLSFEDLKKKKN